jgi:hypothetical protein
MKAFSILVLAVVLSIQSSFAQDADKPQNKSTSGIPSLPAIDIYGAVPIEFKGFGGGFGIFSEPFNLGIKGAANPLQVRFGGDFYFAELNRKKLDNVALAAPQIGDARVRLSQTNLGVNAVARFSLPYSSIITPYLDIFGGIRGYYAGMNITPKVKQSGYESSTSESLSNDWHFAYGATGGVLISINEWVKLNTGLMFTTSHQVGEGFNVLNARVENGSIVGDNMLNPKDMLVLKVGITFLFEGSNSESGRRGRSNCCNCGGRGIFMGSGLGSGGFGKSNSVKINIKPRT